MDVLGRLSDFSEDHPGVAATAILATLSIGTVVGMRLNAPGAGGPAAAAGGPTPVATADAFPSPGETITEIKKIRGEDGSVSTATVLSYVTSGPSGKAKLIRETVRETEPGVRVTATSTSTVAGPGQTVTAPGATSTTVETIVGPGATIIGPGATSTVVAPGPETTVTIAGPASTETVTVEVPVPGPTDTVTVEVPGPEVTVTISVPAVP